MILDKSIEVAVSSRLGKYYEDLGYEIPKIIGKKGQLIYDTSKTINVKICDLKKSSKELVNVECDVCKKKQKIIYYSYVNSINNGGYYTCKDCSHIKYKNTCIEKYGVDNPAKSQKIYNKIKQTNIERYGVSNPFANKEICNKIKNTLLEKYGVDNPMKSKELHEKSIKTLNDNYGVNIPSKSQKIQEKMKDTCMRKYGVDNVFKVSDFKNKMSNTMIERYGSPFPMGCEEIRNKIYTTNINKYGVKTPLESADIRGKAVASMYKNGTCKTSKQQSYICKLYNGIINYPFMNYNLDILIDNNIDVEYDGSGHRLSILFGNVSEYEFKQKEITRNNYLKRAGYYIIRLISSTDKLPSDEVLLKILSLSKEYFNTTNHTWIEWYFDENKFRNADNIEGTFYDFGKLRRISA